MQHSCPNLAFKPIILLPLTSYFLPLHPHNRTCSWIFFAPRASSFPLTPSGFFNGMLGVSESGALNFSTLFCFIPLTLFVSRNLILIYFLLSVSLDSLLCDLIAPTPDLAIFLLMRHSSSGIIIFVRQGLCFSELSTSSLSSLDPYFDYVLINISLNDSSSLSFLSICAPPIRFSPIDSRTDSFSPSYLPICHE